MTTLREAAQQALDALESWQKTCLDCGRASDELGRATTPLAALRAALADAPETNFGDMVQGVDLSAADHTADASKKEGDSLAPPLPNCNGMPAVEGSLSKAQTITFSKVETIEPVAWMVYSLDGQSVCVTDNPADFTDQHRALPLYTAPPQSKENRDD